MGSRIDTISLGNHVYSGLLDDATNYPEWPGGGPKPETLNALLRRTALFEPPVLLNDGYLLHHEWSRNELLNPQSLLRKLISADQIIVLTRQAEGRLDLVPVEMAPWVESYRALVGKVGWPEFEQELKLLSTKERNFKWTPWFKPSNACGFELLIHGLNERVARQPELIDLPTSAWDRTFEHFMRQRISEPRRGARDTWQKSVALTAAREHQAALLNLGNEAYHYNMALLFSGEANQSVAVQTRVSAAFAPSLTTEQPRPFRSPHGYELKGLATLPAKDFVRIATDEEVLSRKQRFLEQKNRYERGSIAAYDHQGVVDAEYELFRAIERIATSQHPGSSIGKCVRWIARHADSVDTVGDAGESIVSVPEFIGERGADIIASCTMITVAQKILQHVIGYCRFRPKATEELPVVPVRSTRATGTFLVDAEIANRHYMKTQALQAQRN
jgi:hypothetical protein